MAFKVDIQKINKTISLISAWILIIGGFLALINWHLNYLSPLESHLSPWPLPYVASICLFLSGWAILFLFVLARFPLVNFLGALIIFFSGFELIEFLLKTDLGSNTLIRLMLGSPPGTTGHLPLLGAVIFFLVGINFLFWSKTSKNPPRNIIRLFLAFTVMILDGIALATFIFPLNIGGGWQSPESVHFYGSIGLFILGSGMLSAAFYFDLLQHTGMAKTLPLLVTIVLIVFDVLMATGIKSDRKQSIKLATEVKGQGLSSEIKEHFNLNLLSLQRMAMRIAYHQTPPAEEWERDTQSFVNDFKEYVLVAWIGNDFNIKSVIQPKTNQPESISSIMPQIREGVRHSQKKQAPHIELLDPQGHEKAAFLLFVPTYWNGEIQGCLLAMIDAKKIFLKSIGDDIKHQYEVFIYSSDLTQISSISQSDYPPEKMQKWTVQTPVHILNLDLLLSIYPSSTFLKRNLSNYLVYLIFFGGLTISFVTGLLFRLYWISLERLQLLQAGKEKIQELQENLNIALRAAKIGSWKWDLSSNKVIWDENMEFSFGFPAKEFGGTYQDFLNLVLPEDRQRIDMELKDIIQKKGFFDLHYRLIWPDGTLHYIIAKGQSMTDGKERLAVLNGICWDITPIKESENLLQTSQSIIKTLSESQSIEEASKKVIEILKTSFNWDILLIFLWDKEADELKPTAAATAPTFEAPQFIAESMSLPPKDKQSLAKRVWSIYRMVTIPDLTADPYFLQIEAAKRDNIRGAIAFPIFQGNRAIGVLELFKSTPLTEKMNEKMENLMTLIGIEVGQFIHRKATESAQEALAAAVTHSNEGIYTYTLDTLVKSWNQAAEKIYGWKAEQIIGQPILKIYPQEKLAEFEMLQKTMLNGDPIKKFITQRLKKDGSLVWVEMALAPMKNTADKVFGTTVVVKDVTEEKKLEAILKQSQEKFRDFVENTEEWIWEMDKQGTFTFSNRGVKSILNFEPEEIIGKNLFDLILQEEVPNLKKEFEESVKKASGWSQRILRYIAKTGGIKFLQSNAQAMLSENKELIGFRGAERDITDLKKADQAKNEFVSMVSHELRTPLTSIYGSLGLVVSKQNLDASVKELVSIAHQNCKRLTAIINDILDIEKIRAGKLEFHLTNLVLADPVREAISYSKPLAEKKEISIIEEGIFSLSKTKGDHARLVQVVMNLLSNAIKFSPPHTHIYLSVQDVDQVIRVSVRDEGTGIPEEFQDRIFQSFSQAPTKDSLIPAGTGLGLNISKKIIDGLGGKIYFTTKKNAGTTFIFELTKIKETPNS